MGHKKDKHKKNDKKQHNKDQVKSKGKDANQSKSKIKDKKSTDKLIVLGGRICPCCKKHCPLTKPQCSKGKAVRAKVLKEA